MFIIPAVLGDNTYNVVDITRCGAFETNIENLINGRIRIYFYCITDFRNSVSVMDFYSKKVLLYLYAGDKIYTTKP